jgi:tetratricopeptide (TPR) repeat protein
MLKSFEAKRDIILCIAMCLAIIVVYWQVKDFKFIYYDDNEYVTEKPQVMAGITWQGVKWAFTATESGFWHPITWLSLMTDREIFNYSPGGFHWTNVILHILNTLLLFFIIKAATAAPLRSAFVALLFAVHPLHVESVAWVSQRKDLLSTLFGFASLYAYIKYALYPTLRKYLTVIILFIFGLMSKPMIVTFPVIMLLLDYWPLKRIEFNKNHNHYDREISLDRFSERSLTALLFEKLPLIFLSVAASILVFYTEKKVGALTSLENLNVAERCANAIVSYVKYLLMTLWPVNLAFIYPHPIDISISQTVGATLFITLITVVIIYIRQRKPYILLGWFWYLIVLFPVIGLIQVGPHAMADRYTYVSIIGLFIIFVWGIADLYERYRIKSSLLWIMASLIIIYFSFCSWIQVGYWRNSITLFEHALKVTKGNYIALANLGYVRMNGGEIEKGIAYTREAIKIKPRYGLLYHNLGVGLCIQERYGEAIEYFKKAQELSFVKDETYRYLGDAYRGSGKNELAIKAYKKALNIKSNNINAEYGLAMVMYKTGRKAEAVDKLKEILFYEPNNIRLWKQVLAILSEMGDNKRLISEGEKALVVVPDDPEILKLVDRAREMLR